MEHEDGKRKTRSKILAKEKIEQNVLLLLFEDGVSFIPMKIK